MKILDGSPTTSGNPIVLSLHGNHADRITGSSYSIHMVSVLGMGSIPNLPVVVVLLFVVRREPPAQRGSRWEHQEKVLHVDM